MPYDVQAIRRQFPILQTQANGKPLIYLDNGATTQKPRAVIDAISRFYETSNANIHRGVYDLSRRATDAYENGRLVVQRFLNAADPSEIIFLRGVTEAANLVAYSWGRANLRRGDVVLVSGMDHHSSLVPWQLITEAIGAVVKPIPVTDLGELDLDALRASLDAGNVKFVAFTHLGNSLGTVNDVSTITRLAHAAGAKVFVDGAQWVAHAPTDVQALGVDFYAFSGHKLFGPTGIGALYGRRELLEAMPPFMGGGDMIESVSFSGTTYAAPPNRFEAGTPDIAGVVGLAAAIDFVQAIGMDAIAKHEAELFTYADEAIRSIPGVRVIGKAAKRASVISFVVDEPKLSAYDVATLLDLDGIAVRSGHHCTQPVMERFCVPATARASFAMYNTKADVDALIASLRRMTAAAKPQAVAKSEPDLAFPEPSADSVNAAADELAETFDFLGDAEQRQQYLMDLSKQIPPMPESLKHEQTRVYGCMSVVHLFATPNDGRLDFLADSDAFIVRGLIGLLQKLFAGQRADEIAAFDVEAFFRRLKLDQHVTAQRRNGLAAMVARLKSIATTVSKPVEAV